MLHYLFCSISTILWSCSWSVTVDQQLNLKHIRIVPIPAPPLLNIERNATGHTILMSGPISFIVEPLTKNLSFEIDQTNTPSLFDTPNAKGGLSYLLSKKADLLLGAFVLNSERMELMDFPYVLMKEHLDLVMPMPFKTVYGICAIWKPLQPAVWWGSIITLVFMVAILAYVLKDTSSLEALLAHGGMVRNQALPHYFVTGSWCLGSLVLVSAYSSVLISFITAPVYQPLVNSLQDLIQKTNVRPVVEKGKAIDLLLQSAHDRVGSVLINRINKDPALRCLKPEDCLQKVRTGNHVYIQSATIALDQIGREYQRTGTCDLTVLRERFMQFHASIALQKKSPFTDMISKRLMRIESAGLIDRWWLKAVTDPTRCLDEARAPPTHPQLSLKELIGAFVLLGFGGVLSLLAYLSEFIFYHQFYTIMLAKKKLLLCA